MKILNSLVSIFKTDAEKKIKRYLITHKFEDLKRIDRKDLVRGIYKAGKEVIVYEDKLEKIQKENQKLRDNYNNAVENIKSNIDDGVKITTDKDLEYAVTKCEIKKKMLATSDELVNVVKTNLEIKTKKFDELVNFLSEYDMQLEYSAVTMELNKTKAELSKAKVTGENQHSTLVADIDEVSKEYELDYKANNLVESKLNQGSVDEPKKSLEERIANL